MLDAGILCAVAEVGCRLSWTAWLSAIAAPVAMVAAFAAMFTHARHGPLWERAGLALICGGSLGQAVVVWSVMFGHPMGGDSLPWWAFQNVGIAVIAAGLTIKHARCRL